MSVRDREVLDLLRDEPELLAIADAVADTQQRPRLLLPFRAIVAVTLAAAAIFVLVLAAPWDRGGVGTGTVLDRALAAIDSSGPVTHMTMRMDVADGGHTFPSMVTESFYDKQDGLVRVISRSEGKIVGDYTTVAAEDEFSFFPGLLEGAAFYKQALANGDARIVGQRVWEGTPVYWLELERGGGLILRIGIARDSYRPVVFRALNPNGTPSGAQVAVLGFDYVPRAQAAFDTEASVLATGRVVGPDCRPAKARVLEQGSVVERHAALRADARQPGSRLGRRAQGRPEEEPDPRGARQKRRAAEHRGLRDRGQGRRPEADRVRGLFADRERRPLGGRASGHDSRAERAEGELLASQARLDQLARCEDERVGACSPRDLE